MKTIIEISIHDKDANPIFGEGVTRVKLEDEAGGGFIVLKQDCAEIRLNIDKLEEIYFAARELMEQYDLK